MRILLIVVGLTLALTACGQSAQRTETDAEPSENPSLVAPSEEPVTAIGAEKAAHEWLIAQNEGDCEVYKKRVTQPQEVDCDEVKELKGSWDGVLDFESAEFEASVTDVSALIYVRDGSEEFGPWDCVWIDGRWLMVLDADDA